MKWIQRKAAKICGRTKGIAEAAEKCNVTKETICHWKKLPGFKELMEEEAKKQLSILDAAADAIDEVTVESAQIPGREGSPDRRLYYQLAGKLVERQKVEVEPLTIIRADKTGESKQAKQAKGEITGDEDRSEQPSETC